MNAIPGEIGFYTLKAAIESKVDVIDIAFYTEDPFKLDEIAKKNNVTAIVDCGVAPGMCHILTGYTHNLLDKTDNVIIYVGGLPIKRELPYEYKVLFNPFDTISEYTRPVTFKENGKLVTKPGLSEAEIIDFPEVNFIFYYIYILFVFLYSMDWVEHSLDIFKFILYNNLL